MKKISEKREKRLEEKKVIRKRMLEIFMDIWNSRMHRSEVSGKRLGNEPLTTFFHHILPKSKYPDATLDPDNIILLTFEEHQKVENDFMCYDEMNKRREKLKLKYDKHS